MRHFFRDTVIISSFLCLSSVAWAADEYGPRPSKLNASFGFAWMVPKTQTHLFTNKNDTGQLTIEAGRQMFPHFMAQLNMIGGRFNGTGQYSYNGLADPAADLKFWYGVFGLGAKFMLFESYFLQPFAEAGGLFGYQYLAWGRISDRLPGAKNNDYDLLFGNYYGVGLDAIFTQQFGIRIYYRHQYLTGQAVDTLGPGSFKMSSHNAFIGFMTYFR